ncbi:LysE family translocator [Brevibacillus reuszeri]|uniref:LysE family translocator n=1 Tax=Brevibacillus reuszeri TaxID=54915 RepID=UPI002897D46B|nr:LysE family transporter [Brevibacillus reuszeri]
MALWDGLLFGMLLQLSVGPVCLAILQRSIRCGFSSAWKMIAGVALVDAFYMAGAIGGLSLLLQVAWVKQVVLIGGAVILAWFGVNSMRSKVMDETGEDEREGSEMREPSSFLYGLSLTLANPLTILFWSGVFGSMMATQHLPSLSRVLLFAGGCLLSTLLFLGFVALLGNAVRQYLVPKWLTRLNRLVGICFIAFALILLQKGLTV